MWQEIETTILWNSSGACKYKVTDILLAPLKIQKSVIPLQKKKQRQGCFNHANSERAYVITYCWVHGEEN